MKERPLILVLSLTFFLSIGFYFLISFLYPSVFLAPPSSLHIPTDCSNQEIQALWNDVFKQQNPISLISNPTTIIGKCSAAFAFYETNQGNFHDMYLLSIITQNNSQNVTSYITAYHGNFTNSFYSMVFTYYNDEDYLSLNSNLLNSQGKIIDDANFLDSYIVKRSSPVLTTNQASSKYTSLFNEIPSVWSLDSSSQYFGFGNQYNSQPNNRTVIGNVYTNFSYENTHIFDFIFPIICTENWQQINTTCLNGNFAIWYNDTNSCGTTTNLPTGIYGNNTIHPCSTSCIQNWTAVNTTCINGLKTQYWNDTNMCNNKTGIPANNSFSCITTLHLPTSCSNSEIQSTWDSIYFENSSGITILTNSTNPAGCGNYFAYKLIPQQTFAIAGFSNGTSQSQIFAIQGNFTSAGNSNITTLNQADLYQGNQMNKILSLKNTPNQTASARLNVTSEQQAELIFNSIFALKNESSILYSGSSDSYYFKLNQTSTSSEIFKSGIVYTKYGLNFYSYNYTSNCTPEWTVRNTTCINQNLTQYWTDSSCNLNPETNGHPNQTLFCIGCASWTPLNTTCNNGNLTTWYNNTNTSCSAPGTPPANITYTCPTCANWTVHSSVCRTDDTILNWYTNTNTSCTFPGTPQPNFTTNCDYNNLGIIGTVSNVQKTNINFNDPNGVLIDGEPINYTFNYTGNLIVQFMEGSTQRLRFYFDFTKPSALNLKAISLTKQGSSSEFGYLKVNGIEVNKTINIDKKNSASSKVCVKDSSLANSITSSCTGTNEYLIDCPGNNANFSCSSSGNITTISGLRHSIVQEFIATSDGGSDGSSGGSTGGGSGQVTSGSCSPNWYCSSWSECVGGTQTQTCSDINNCNTSIGRPAGVQTCGFGTGSNSIPSTNSSSPSNTPSNTRTLIIIASLVILIMIIIITILIILAKRGKNKATSGKSDYSPRYQVTSGPPPSGPSPPLMPRIPMQQQRPPNPILIQPRRF